MIEVHDVGREQALGDLSRFRQEFYNCLTTRADGMFELADAVLCTDGPVRSLVGLSLAPEHRHGHGALYDAVNDSRLAVLDRGRPGNRPHLVDRTARCHPAPARCRRRRGDHCPDPRCR